MPRFKDADGVRWSVHRRWMPLLEYLEMTSWGNSWFGVLMFVVALPFLLAWPFWMLGKLCGVPWKVVVRRNGDDFAEEKVKGWKASRERIDEIAHGLQVSGAVPPPGQPPQDLRPYS